jgi:valyl-tRNA synthetase
MGGEYDRALLDRFDQERAVIMAIRNERQARGIPQKEKIRLSVKKNLGQLPDTRFDPVVIKMSNLENLGYVDEKVEGASTFIVGTTEFYIPLSEEMDLDTEIEKLQKDLAYQQGFLRGVLAKLGNERFVSGAPANVVDLERKKQADAEAKIKVIEAQLAGLVNRRQ